MKNKSKTAATCAAVLLSSFLITGLALGTGQSTGIVMPEEPAENVYAETDKYIVRTYNGNIAVFHGEFQNMPAIETKISVSTLRTMDKALLEDGIKLTSYEEVMRLLEDFGP